MQRTEDRSLGELLGDLARETGLLVRNEVALAKAEMSQKASHVGRHAGIIGAGGALAYAGLLAIVAGIIVLLDTWLPLWGAALLVGIILAAIGGAMAMNGVNGLKKENFAPEQTIETLKEDVEWAKQQTR
jgi:predicted phage tail protein